MITIEDVKEIGITPEQLEKLTPVLTTKVAELQKGWDGKANELAEGILTGAAAAVEKLTGVKREHGQKVADYIAAAAPTYLTVQKAELEAAKSKYDEMLKTGANDEQLKKQLAEVSQKFDAAQKDLAEFEEWKKENYKGKYEEVSQKMSANTLKMAFKEVKPAKPNELNQYEYNGRWKEFEQRVLEAYNIEIDSEDVAWAIDKNNQYKRSKLSDIVASDKEITEMLKGRQQTGTGSQKSKGMQYDGVPFEVPETATASERTKLISDYLVAKGLNKLSDQYAKEFAAINKAYLEKKPAQNK